jgi:hypothetical protein
LALGILFFALLFLGVPSWAGAVAENTLFTVVSENDPVYGQLHQLAETGLLSPQDAKAPLTRFDVARDILKAQDQYDEIVLADAAPVLAAGNRVVPSPPPPPKPQLSQAGTILHNLEETYQYELGKLKDSVKALGRSMDDLENQEYGLRKRVKGIEQFPTIAVHGLGRAFGLSQQYSGDDPNSLYPNPGYRLTYGFLDLEPEAIVTKEIKFNGTVRVETNFSPSPFNTEISTSNFSMDLRRICMEFNPPWLSAVLGDFEQSYTPLTLWNRDNLDLMYEPEMWARQDETSKYESFFDHEPDWPLRGLRLGTRILWPDSDVVDELKLSTFVHMIRNGFDGAGISNSWYFGFNQFADWLVGGTASLKSKKWYSGDISWQASLDTYGLILDEPLNTDLPRSVYNPNDPTTWGHQYLIGSMKPDLKVGLGNDFYAGATGEYAYSSYQDDKMDSQRVIGDWALNGGPYVQFGASRISFNYLSVGPYYYSPAAQTRQDAVTSVSSVMGPNSSAELWPPPLRGQDFLSDVPRAGQIYSFYDRTQDNTFPYGLATPNRQGFGMEMDIQALERNALKVKGAAYLVQEIQADIVASGSQYMPVDAYNGVVPVRKFAYANLGPSFNFGPSIGLDRDLEVGTNIRMEQTTSSMGTLTSTWILGGVRADILPVWELSAAFSQQNANGTDTGYVDGSGNPTLWARYVYLFDATDLGQYKPFTVDGSIESVRISNAFKVNRNSSIYLDYDWTTGNMMPNNPALGTVNNQYVEVTYEVKF